MNNFSEENQPYDAQPSSNRNQRGVAQKGNSKLSQAKLGLKIIIIVVMGLLMLIPQHMILSLIRERNTSSRDAESEVGRMWSREQTIVGPVVLIPGRTEKIPDAYLLPEELTVNGDVQTQKLHKGIFDVAVFTSDLDMHGNFQWSKLEEMGIHPDQYDFDGARLLVGLGDLRGLTDNVVFTLGGKDYKMGSGQDKELGAVIVSPISLAELMTHDSAEYRVKLGLKGSRNLHFFPVGGATSVHLVSNCATPNFQGNFLPVTREVSDQGFEATWKVLSLNTSLREVMTDWSRSFWYDNENGESFGVEVRLPVEQYQQNERSIKYAFLIIVLTFATVFFVEIRTGVRIHPVQYLLVGVALLLYYTLLLSFSEHVVFWGAYLIASVMTIALITIFMAAILKEKKPALLVGGLLAVLYGFIYILMQMETYALLAGSIGLFIILAVAMFITSRIKWYNS
ncbi:MAG: cell envelope integrity protein CreD [Bacteroidales bacterium]|nr:cell envelope integrity protein CreD [Bacteroidales bacterium]